MTPFSYTHDFLKISKRFFEDHLNTPKLNEMLLSSHAYKARELIHFNDGSDTKKWEYKVTLEQDLPKALQKIFSDNLCFIEKSQFFKNKNEVHFKIEPVNKSIKLFGSGKWFLQDTKQGCQRIIEGHIEVKIPIVGKIAEKFIAAELDKFYEKEPKILEQYFKTLS